LIADVVRPRLKAHVDLLDSIYRNEDAETFRGTAGRHRLIEELIPDIREGELHPAAFLTGSPNLLEPGDFEWALTRIETSLRTPDESAWVEVARMAFELPISESDFEELERLCEKSEEPRERLGVYVSSVRIDSPEADSLREHHRYHRRPVEDPPDRAEEMSGVVEEHLLSAERGEEGSWWRLNHSLLFNEHGRGEPRLGEWEAGWRRSSSGVQMRIARLARPSLDDELPDPEEWFAGQTFNRGAYAGYRALYLLAKLDRESFDGLPNSIWERWMPIVIDYPSTPRSEGENQHGLILRRAAGLAGSSFASWAVRKLCAEAEGENGSLFFLHPLELIEAPEVKDAVVSMVADWSLRPTSLKDLLGFVLPRDPERSHELAAPRLAGADCEFENNEARECAVICAAKLLALAPGLAYSDVAAFLDRCPEVVEDVILGIAREERSSLVTQLGDQELGDLVERIFKHFPEAKDPPLEEGYVSPRESLVDFRRWLLDALAERGTELGVDLIAAIYEEQKTATLRFSLRKARDAQRAKSPAPSPGEVVRLVRGGESSPRTQAELLSRVVAALGTIQSALQVGQPPTAPELWNTRPVKTPKDEGDLSNWLSGRLSRELGTNFDVSRERLVSGGGRGRGKSVDLQVSCYAPDGSSQPLQLLIEVKGCWEAGLSGKIRTQLAEDYMLTTGIREAIFLVFWFGSGVWDASDGRRARSGFASADEARRKLRAEAQAVDLDFDLQIEVVIFDGSLSLDTSTRVT
jgi:hypothetical protein